MIRKTCPELCIAFMLSGRFCIRQWIIESTCLIENLSFVIICVWYFEVDALIRLLNSSLLFPQPLSFPFGSGSSNPWLIRQGQVHRYNLSQSLVLVNGYSVTGRSTLLSTRVVSKQLLIAWRVCLCTEEEINNMQKELEKYGIQMPAFSKIGGILANELSVDEAAGMANNNSHK